MSRTPFFFVEKFDFNTNQYELQHPIIWNYDHTKQEIADLFPYNGCHDLFSIVEGNKGDFPRMRGIHEGLPENISKEIKEQSDDFSTIARWFSYADMYIYCLEHPTMPNPMKELKERVDMFLEIMDCCDMWRENYSSIRIVYWIE